MLLATLALIASTVSMSVLAAPASLESRQNINLCSPYVPDRATSVLAGGKVSINAGSKLYWNATFPKRDFLQGFTDVRMAHKIDGKDWTVSEWYVETAQNATWKINSRVGPGDDQWCLTTDAKSAPCSQAATFEITCNDCSKRYGPFRGCSIRQGGPDRQCLSWGKSAGSNIVPGMVLYGPYDCPELVDIERIYE